MNMNKDFFNKDFELSKITQNDLIKLYPQFPPLLIDIPNEISDDEFRVLEIVFFC